MRYWLVKADPSDISVDDLRNRPNGTIAWYGIRNYQSRNFMRDQMSVGDQILFYHSSCKQPGIVGTAEVCKLAYPDSTQFDPNSKYFDLKATSECPRWFNVDIKLVSKSQLISIKELRGIPALKGMRILQKGNRLSITPVDPAEWKYIIGIMR